MLSYICQYSNEIVNAIMIFLTSTIVIQIVPIKINPWSYIARKLGKALNGEVIEKVNKIETILDNHLNQYKEDKADDCRQQILDFNDELLHHTLHSKEHFESILECIDFYEDYCKSNPDYPNNKCLLAIENIKDKYKACLENNDFLV